MRNPTFVVLGLAATLSITLLLTVNPDPVRAQGSSSGAGALPPGDYSRIELGPSWAETRHWTAEELQDSHEQLVAGGDRDEAFSSYVTRTHAFIMVHRPPLASGQEPLAEFHEGASDVYFIVEGNGELIIGGEIENQRLSRPGEILGTMVGGRSLSVSKGDIINIPPSTSHATVPGPDGLTYVLQKVNVGMYPWSLINGSP